MAHTLLLVNHDNGATEMVRGVPEGVPLHALVERYQKNAARFRAGHRLPGVTAKWAEDPALVPAMIELALLTKRRKAC